MIKDAGFECVDFSYYAFKTDSPTLGEGYIEYAKELRAYLDEIGLECSQAHAPYIVGYDATFDLSDINYRATVHSIESAAILGAKSIIVHNIPVPKEKKELSFWELNQTYYKSLIPVAEKAGICIAVENLYSYDDKRECFVGRLGSPRELNAFVKEVNSPWVVACVDVGHASITGYEPEDFIAGMDGDILKAIHIHDGDYLGDRHTLPYLGRFHWDDVLAALKKVGFEGNLNFEIISYLNKLPVELLPDALRLAEKTGRYMINNFNNL
jgi:sugar phosphate isomerase/epimerase